MKRRDFIKGTLQATGLAAFCSHLSGCNTPSQKKLEGTFLDPSWKLGHQIRDRTPYASTQNTKSPIAILGGGVSGLACWWRLSQTELASQVHLFELEEKAGGNSRGSAITGFQGCLNAHYLTLPNPQDTLTPRLLRDLGVLEGDSYKEEFLIHVPQERLFEKGFWHQNGHPLYHSTPQTQGQGKKFSEWIDTLKEQRGADGRYLFSFPVESSSQDPKWRKLDQISFQDWLDEEGYTDPGLLWYLDYACRDDYGSNLKDTSAWAGLLYFAGRRGSQPQYKDSHYLSWPQGNQYLTDRMLKGLPPERQHYRHVIRSIENTPSKITFKAFDATTQKALTIESEHCVYCLPSFLRPHLFQNPQEHPVKSFTYSPWATAQLLLEYPYQVLYGYDASLCWDNVIYGSPSLGYIYNGSQELASQPIEGVLTWYYPACEQEPRRARQTLLDTSWRQWRDRVIKDLQKPHPHIADHIKELHVYLNGHAMIRPTPGFLTSSELRQANRSQGNLHFAHSDLSGVSTFENALYQGVWAAEKILANHQINEPSWIGDHYENL